MRTLEDDSYERTEKAKRSKLYRYMLDEQVKNKRSERNQERNLTSPVHQYPDMHLPPIEEKIRRHEPNANYTPPHETSEDDLRTEAYLNNCEDIIRNLKELKDRRRRKSTIPINNKMSSPINNYSLQYNEQLQSQQMERLYYPRPTYFSPTYHHSQVAPRGNRDLMKKAERDRIRTQNSDKMEKKERKEKKAKEQGERRKTEEPESKIEQELPKTKKEKPKKSKRSSLAHSRVRERVPQSYLQESPLNKGVIFPIQETPIQETPIQGTPESERPRGLANIQKMRRKFTPNGNGQDRNYQYFQKKSKEPPMEVKKTGKPDQMKEVLKSLKDLTELMRAKTPVQSRVEIATSTLEEENQAVPEVRKVEEEKEQEQRLKKAILAKLKHANRSGNSLLQKIESFRKNHTTTQSIKQVNAPDRTLVYNEELMAHLREMVKEKDAQSYEVVSCLRELTHYLKQQNQKIDQVSLIINETSGNSQSLKQSRSKKIESNCFELSLAEQDEKSQEQQESFLPLKAERSEVTENRKQQLLQRAVLVRLKKAKTRGTIFMEKMEKFKKNKEAKIQSRIRSIPNRQTYDPQNDQEVPPVANPEESSIIPSKESVISEPGPKLLPQSSEIEVAVSPSNQLATVDAVDLSKAPV